MLGCLPSKVILSRMRGTAGGAEHASVVVWSVPLEAEAVETPRLTHLSTAEREIASRFQFEADRQRYLRSHCALRSVLADALRTDPGGLEFASGKCGKPALTGRFLNALSFNLSHCDDLAVVAVSRECEMGVDVECERIVPDVFAVAKMVFSPPELQSLVEAAEPERSRRFLHYWTRKEALIKGTGEGISDHLSEIDTSGGSEWAALRLLSGDHVWTVESLGISNRHVAAVAARASAIEIQHKTWRW
jgi:4'-phosphopantetheinyl transferase